MIGEVRARSDLKPSSSLSLLTTSLGWRQNVQGLPGTGIRQSCNPVCPGGGERFLVLAHLILPQHSWRGRYY